MGFRKPKSMLKGLEIKKPTDIEVEECKEGHSHGHGHGHRHKKYIKGLIEDSDASDQFFDH